MPACRRARDAVVTTLGRSVELMLPATVSREFATAFPMSSAHGASSVHHNTSTSALVLVAKTAIATLLDRCHSIAIL